MKAEFRERKQAIRNFMQAHYTDERLAMLLAHAQEGRLDYATCCCFVGIATVDHELRSWSMDRSFSWREPHYKTAQELEGAFLAELAYESLGDKAIGRDRDTLRRSILIPMIRAEMRRRDRAKQVCELVCTETTV